MTDKKLPTKATFSSTVKSVFNPIDFMVGNMLKHDKLFRSSLMGFSAYVVHDVDYIRYILNDNHENYVKRNKYNLIKLVLGDSLFTSDGEQWKKQRKKIQPIFHHRSIQNSMDIMIQESLTLANRIKNQRVVDITNELSLLTFNIVTKSIIGADNTEEVIEKIRKNITHAAPSGSFLLKLPTDKYPEWILNTAFLKKFKSALDSTDEIILDLIEQRKNQTDRIDLLSLLIQSDVENEDIDMKQIRDEVKTMLLVGSDTTQLSLAWTLLLLSSHEQIKQKVYDEIKEEVKSTDNISFETLGKLKYLDCVIDESLRLYPPAFATGRQSVSEDYLDDYYVPPEKNIIINFYGLHRCPEYWDDPNLFNPSRFEKQGVSKSKLPFMPFGYGPRVCIGASFSLLEMKILLTVFLLNFDFTAIDKDIFPKPLLTLSPNKNIKLKLVNRKQGGAYN